MRLILIWFGVAFACGAASPASGEPSTPGSVTRAPQVEQAAVAAYPPQALTEHLRGEVALQVDISESGQVLDVQVLKGAGHGFDEAAVEALKQFRFTPAQIDGKPASVRITYVYTFEPPEQPAAASPPPAPVNFTGTLLERGTRKPLVGVEVALPELGQSAVSDVNGQFSLAGVPEGEQRVVAVAPGYRRFETRERVTAGQLTTVVYYLESELFSPYESVVRGQRERKEVSQTTLTLEEVQKAPGTQGDGIKIVENLPGVAHAPGLGGELIIRGTSPEDSGVYLDGMRIPILFHFGGLTSVYNSDLLQSVDFLPGNSSVFYGDQIGGVVDVRSRAPRTDGFHGSVTLSLLDASVQLEGPITSTLSFALAGRRSFIDALLAAMPSGNDQAPDFAVAPRYQDAQLMLQWKPDAHNTVTLLAVTSDDVLGLVFQRPSDADPNVAGNFALETGFTQLRLRHRYVGPRLRVDTTALIGRDVISIDVGAAASVHILPHEYSLRSSVEYDVTDTFTAAAGVDTQYIRATLAAATTPQPREGEPPSPSSLQKTLVARGFYTEYLPAAWVEARLRLGPRLLLVPGLRTESYLYSDQQAPDRSVNPRLGMRFKLSDAWVLKAGAGEYHEPAQQGEPTAATGNPEIRAKRAEQFSLGTEWTIGAADFASLEGFYNAYSQLYVSNATPPPFIINDGVGRAYGAELLVRHALTQRFFGWLAYTLSRSERRDHTGDPWRPFDSDETHVLTVLGSYKLGAGWQLGARFRYATGTPFTPAVGAVRNDGLDIFAPIYGAVNSQRLPAFHQLDVRVDKTWVFDRWSLDAYLDLLNAYNHASVEGVTYNYNYSQREYFRGLPVLPVLGAKGSF
ncbi:MAG: TonB-dependent receptor [Deltaproteobacteria bacterium]|nr:TonB-dependent receptor [Deltaproteobacteria bacterium]